MRVEDAHGAAPTIPFWRGEAPGRTIELSAARSSVREEDRRAGAPPRTLYRLPASRVRPGTRRRRAGRRVRAGRSAPCWARSPTTADRRSPSASSTKAAACSSCSMRRSGRASTEPGGWRCASDSAASFNFELQAAATDNGIVISLGEQHSFPLEIVFEFLRPEHGAGSADPGRAAAPMFASTLAMERDARAGAAALLAAAGKCRRTSSACAPTTCSPRFSRQRRRARKSSAARFASPDHPLVQETIRDCLPEAMDIDGLTTRAAADRPRRDSPCSRSTRPSRRPSATKFSTRIRTPTWMMRRWKSAARAPWRCGACLPTAMAGDWSARSGGHCRGAREAWPVVRDASEQGRQDELHDVLYTLIALPVPGAHSTRGPIQSMLEQSLPNWRASFNELGANRGVTGRACEPYREARGAIQVQPEAYERGSSAKGRQGAFRSGPFDPVQRDVRKSVRSEKDCDSSAEPERLRTVTPKPVVIEWTETKGE